MIAKILAGALGSVVIIAVFLYWRLSSAQVDIAILEVEVAVSQDAVDSLSTELVKQTNALKTQSDNNNIITAENKRYLSIFKRHNLTKLAEAKPTLIENAINNGTQEVFDELENDSRNISSLDD